MNDRGWGGARWQADLTAGGVPVDESAAIDATTTPEARARLVRVAARLGELGVGVRERQDEGEDADGNAVLYDQLVVDVGEGYMAVCFWRSTIFWSVDVRPEHLDGDRFRQVARAVLAAVEATGFRASTPFDDYEARAAHGASLTRCAGQERQHPVDDARPGGIPRGLPRSPGTGARSPPR